MGPQLAKKLVQCSVEEFVAAATGAYHKFEPCSFTFTALELATYPWKQNPYLMPGEAFHWERRTRARVRAFWFAVTRLGGERWLVYSYNQRNLYDLHTFTVWELVEHWHLLDQLIQSTWEED